MLYTGRKTEDCLGKHKTRQKYGIKKSKLFQTDINHLMGEYTESEPAGNVGKIFTTSSEQVRSQLRPTHHPHHP